MGRARGSVEIFQFVGVSEMCLFLCFACHYGTSEIRALTALRVSVFVKYEGQALSVYGQ